MPDACHIASTLIPLPQLYITIHQTAANHLQIAKVPFVSCSWSGCATPPLIATGAKFSREIRVVLITSAVSKKKKKRNLCSASQASLPASPPSSRHWGIGELFHMSALSISGRNMGSAPALSLQPAWILDGARLCRCVFIYFRVIMGGWQRQDNEGILIKTVGNLNCNINQSSQISQRTVAAIRHRKKPSGVEDKKCYLKNFGFNTHTHAHNLFLL